MRERMMEKETEKECLKKRVGEREIERSGYEREWGLELVLSKVKKVTGNCAQNEMNVKKKK